MAETFADRFMSQFFSDGVNAKQERSDVKKALGTYFGTDADGYTGSQFELLIKDSDPFKITAIDLIAITTLSVKVPERAALWILSPVGEKEISKILREIPIDTDIWDPKVKNIFADNGKVMELWNLLGNANWPTASKGGGLGGLTKRSKILAAKRPRLIPILDRVVVGTLLQTENRWRGIQDVLNVESYRNKLEEALKHDGVPPSVSLLRRIDVVIWFNNQAKFRKKK